MSKMKISTVRITEKQHHWIQQNHPQQLSHIVRSHIEDLMQRKTPVNFHNAWRESAQKCYPFLSEGYCSICWPGGIPNREDWQRYLRENTLGNSRSSITWEEWTMNNHFNRQSILDEWNPETIKFTPDIQEKHQERTPGFLERLWKRISLK